MINLRPYQETITDGIRKAFRQMHNRIIMQAPTGSGKTVIFSYMVKRASVNKKKCLILTDRIELLEQAGGTFERIGIDYKNITAKTKSVPNTFVAVAMVETIKRRAKSRLDFQMYLKTVDLLIIDEAHKAAFDPIFAYLSDSCYVIGATATPIRQNAKKPLSDYFSLIVEGPSIEYLISMGYLAAPTYYGIPVDLSKIKITRGDYDEKQMEKLYSETKLFHGLHEELEKRAQHKKTLIFCANVASSIQVANELKCLHVDGDMRNSNPKLFKYNMEKFENEPETIMTNCGILTTGYDNPTIEHGVSYRATTSLPLWLQMVGRLSRMCPEIGKKTFTWSDFGMNIQRFGYWHIDRKWSLEPQKKKSRKKDVFPVKFCPQCGAIVSVNSKMCECGYIWPVTEKERVFAELQELSYKEVQKRMNEAKTIEEMEEIRISKNYKVGFLLHRFNTEDQFKEYEKFKGYKKGWANHQIRIYLK